MTSGTAPIFVVGYMHSGTTLLLDILSRHSAVYGSIGETKFFHLFSLIQAGFPDLSSTEQAEAFGCFCAGLIPGQVQLGAHGWDVRATLDDLDSSARAVGSELAERMRGRTYGESFRIVFDELTGRAGKQRWLEKTPTHIFHLEEIKRAIPDARIVEIVRDPRDVLASKKTRRSTVWNTDRYRPEQRAFKHLEKAYDPVWDTLSWKSAIRTGRRADNRYPGQIYTIRYEDLVEDPDSTVRGICAALGLAFEPAMLAIRSRNAAEVGVVGGRISSDSVGRWRRVLSSAEVTLCQGLTRAEMATLEYKPEEQGLGARIRVPFHLARASVEFGIRLYRRYKMGGMPLLTNTVSGYWRRSRNLLRQRWAQA